MSGSNTGMFCEHCFTPTGLNRTFRSKERYDEHMKSHQSNPKPTPMIIESVVTIGNLGNRLEELAQEIKLLRLANDQANSLQPTPKPTPKPMRVTKRQKDDRLDELIEEINSLRLTNNQTQDQLPSTSFGDGDKKKKKEKDETEPRKLKGIKKEKKEKKEKKDENESN